MGKLGTWGRKAAKMLRALPSYDKRDPHSNVVDALTNLRHYCGEKGLDFAAALGTSDRNYSTEHKGA